MDIRFDCASENREIFPTHDSIYKDARALCLAYDTGRPCRGLFVSQRFIGRKGCPRHEPLPIQTDRRNIMVKALPDSSLMVELGR